MIKINFSHFLLTLNPGMSMFYLIKAHIKDSKKHIEAHKMIREQAKSNARLKHYYISRDGKEAFEIWETTSKDLLKTLMNKHLMNSATFEIVEIEERMLDQSNKRAA